ncbi:Ndc80-like chromosome segregation protein [Hamiltosporidium tvaerminnensis]|uniref:Kinetochore protein NDC80 n=1 Tax=Hamiltosporidium tvaerminnensis TaxID=1176355 RepID=A0A4V2JXJ0_9MICR|nr:Ndc80-like chromosome segregation protein [Hamiltosporidium tvaerminnensis]TBU11992.1 Ndc80-like chromosome segregation protein [Hamiltosporidium tvaerminnensis]
MQRTNMTPTRRKSVKPSTNLPPRFSVSMPRQSVMREEDTKRRDARQVRDRDYQQTCQDIVYKFLVENGYQGVLSVKTLQAPSLKDFQTIFKFIFSFIDSKFEFSQRFEEDIMTILKMYKYAFSSEINRSQLIAMTPHTWPAVLSMLSWLVGLVFCFEGVGENSNLQEENILENLFFDFVCHGYQKFLEGDEDEENLDEELNIKINNMYIDSFNEIEEKRSILKEIENKIENFNDKNEEKLSLENRKNGLLKDMNDLNSAKKLLDEKQKKYENYVNKLTEELNEFENEANQAKIEIEDLKNIISTQKINPCDVRVMNTEKEILIKELENLKPEKERLLKMVGEFENIYVSKVDEGEKLLFDLKGIRNQPLPFLISKEKEREEKMDLKFNSCEQKNDLFVEKGNSPQKSVENSKYLDFDFRICEEYKIIGNTDEYVDTIDKEVIKERDEFTKYEISNKELLERKSNDESACKEMERNIKIMEEKLYSVGKIYLEKKELSDKEQQKSRKELEKIESDLLRLQLDSNNSLLISEQTLQRAKINVDRIIQTSKSEKDEVEKLLANFNENLQSYYKIIRSYMKELENLVPKDIL